MRGFAYLWISFESPLRQRRVAVLKETIMAFAKVRETQFALHFAGTKVPKHALALPWLREKVRDVCREICPPGGSAVHTCAFTCLHRWSPSRRRAARSRRRTWTRRTHR